MLDDTALTDWCRRHLGSPVERALFRSGFLSQVVGVELASGLRAVVKVRPAEPRLEGCLQVQTALVSAGFPCPEPLTQVTHLDGLAVTAETLVSGGTALPTEPGAAPFAALLARLVALAPSPDEIADLSPAPPWAAWDHPGQRLWPDLDEHGQDLNLVTGPAWVDDAARRVRERLLAAGGEPRIGHGDWETPNLRWTGNDPLVVHDWDSVVTQPEPAIVGLAAALWPREDGSDPSSSLAQADDFITAYLAVADRTWSVAEVADAWAAGLWLALVFTQQEAAEGGTRQHDHLAPELGGWLERADPT